MEKELKDKIEKKAEKLASMFAGNGGGVLIAGCVKNEDGSSDSYVCLKGRGLSVAEALGALCKKIDGRAGRAGFGHVGSRSGQDRK